MQKDPTFHEKLTIKRSKSLKAGSNLRAKGRKSKTRGESKRKFGYWRNSEQAKYVAFLRDNYLIMKNSELRAEFQIFKRMSSFIGSRDPIQCKSHHQKMLMRNNNKLESIIQLAGTNSESTAPEYLYREQKNGTMEEHLGKIETSEELPYFMIKSAQKLLIVIDQRFMTSY